MPPVFQPKEKYRAVQSSNAGTVMVQAGHVFDAAGECLGRAPKWGPAIFRTEGGQPKDPYATLLAFAKEHPPAAWDPVEEAKKAEAAKPKVDYDLKPEISDADAKAPLTEKEPIPEKEPDTSVDDVFDEKPLSRRGRRKKE